MHSRRSTRRFLGAAGVMYVLALLTSHGGILSIESLADPVGTPFAAILGYFGAKVLRDMAYALLAGDDASWCACPGASLLAGVAVFFGSCAFLSVKVMAFQILKRGDCVIPLSRALEFAAAMLLWTVIMDRPGHVIPPQDPPEWHDLPLYDLPPEDHPMPPPDHTWHHYS